MHIHFQLAQQCIQISTRINSSSVHTYIFVCFTLRVILQGFVTQNATKPLVELESNAYPIELTFYVLASLRLVDSYFVMLY